MSLVGNLSKVTVPRPPTLANRRELSQFRWDCGGCSCESAVVHFIILSSRQNPQSIPKLPPLFFRFAARTGRELVTNGIVVML